MPEVPLPLRIIAGLALVLSSEPAQPAPKPAEPAWPVQLRQDLDRLGQMEWRLHRAAGDRCPMMAADAGLTFDDRRAYPKDTWPLLASTIGMAGAPVIAAVGNGSPAADAGIRPGDEVVAMADTPVEQIVRGDSALAADTLADFVAGHPPGQPLRIVLRRAGAPLAVDVVPVRHCAARFILVTDDSVEAHSDGRNIAVSTGLLRFAQSEDELALLAGHELGHVLHSDGKARNLADRRDKEDAADIAGAQLVRCAGYDVNKAAEFFDRYGRRDILGFMRIPTHRAPHARAERIRSAPPGDFCQPSTGSPRP